MTPVHTDTRKFNFFDPLLLIMAAIMVIQGLMIPNDIPILAGIGVMVFLAFTRHTRYALYGDALVIHYWAPRKIVIPLSEIRDVGSVRLPFTGASLIVHRTRGRVIAIMPKDPESFREHLKAGLDAAKQPPPAPDAGAEAPTPRARRRRPRRQKPS